MLRQKTGQQCPAVGSATELFLYVLLVRTSERKYVDERVDQIRTQRSMAFSFETPLMSIQFQHLMMTMMMNSAFISRNKQTLMC